MQRSLSLFKSTQSGAVYELDNCRQDVSAFVASTKYSRRICNDPFCLGLDYTDHLRDACSEVLQTLELEPRDEKQTVVTNILRGGLNFCLREALGKALGWNLHSSAFLSAQRVRSENSPTDWFITEDSYKKVDLPNDAIIVLGDVVATGTSLDFALKALSKIAIEQNKNLQEIIFFTIGGEKTEDILASFVSEYRKVVPTFKGARVIYLEGCFSVASENSPLKIAIPGTDLLRRDCPIAPEFFQSQLEQPSYPLERCTIYDAGSRAFHLQEYLEDLKDYWEKTSELAKQGMTFELLLSERMPELPHDSFTGVDLEKLCSGHLETVNVLLNGYSN